MLKLLWTKGEATLIPKPKDSFPHKGPGWPARLLLTGWARLAWRWKGLAHWRSQRKLQQLVPGFSSGLKAPLSGAQDAGEKCPEVNQGENRLPPLISTGVEAPVWLARKPGKPLSASLQKTASLVCHLPMLRSISQFFKILPPQESLCFCLYSFTPLLFLQDSYIGPCIHLQLSRRFAIL